MFMMEKSIVIVTFMICLGWGILIAQFLFSDAFGYTLTNYQGKPIRSAIINSINVNVINNVQTNMTSTTRSNIICSITSGVACAISTIAGIAWEFILLMSGTYVFNFLALMGVPTIAIWLFIAIYVIYLARTVIGLVRGL